MPQRNLLLGLLIVIFILALVSWSRSGTQTGDTVNYTHSLEILNASDNFAPVDEPVLDGQNHFVVASSTDIVPERLPINLEIRRDDRAIWRGTIEGDPAVVCRDMYACSADGPELLRQLLGMGLDEEIPPMIEVIATDKDGNTLLRQTFFGTSPETN